MRDGKRVKKETGKETGKRILRRAVLAALGLALGVNLYLGGARMVGGNAMPMPFGVGAAVVLSGSMEPALGVGDLIFVRQSETLAVGDVVVYASGGSLVVHRIVALEGDTVVTQGDANNTADEPISRAAIKGVVTGRVPRVGTALRAMRSPVGVMITLAAAFGLVEWSFRREKAEDDRKRAEIEAEIRRLKDTPPDE